MIQLEHSIRKEIISSQNLEIVVPDHSLMLQDKPSKRPKIHQESDHIRYHQNSDIHLLS